MGTDRDGAVPDILANHRLVTILFTIPERLDRAGQLLDDALDLVARYGLAEALQPDLNQYTAVSVGPRAAANRIRAAGAQIPGPSDWSPRVYLGGEPGRSSPGQGVHDDVRK
jgi:hypothetical protein